MEDIKRARKATEDLLQILNGVTKENYDLVRRQILLREIRLPRGHVGFLLRLFKKPISSSALTGEEFNKYLKSFLFTSCEIPIVIIPSFTSLSYFEVGNFLRTSSIVIKKKKQDLLIHQCHYGYFLELFYQLHVEKQMKGETNEKFSETVKKEFDISNRHAGTLRWLGRLWCQYKKIGHLGISLSKIYSHRVQVETLFHNHPELSKEWIIEEKVDNHLNRSSNSSDEEIVNNQPIRKTNPFYHMLKK